MASVHEFDKAASDIRQEGVESPSEAMEKRELIRYATLAASSHNTQPWKFRIGLNAISIIPDFLRRCPVVDPDDSHLFKSLGCATENVVHAAAARGLFSEVSVLPGRGGIEVELKRAVRARETSLFRAILHRQCARTTYDGKSIGRAELKELEEAAEGPHVHPIILTSKAQKEAMIEYVTEGNRAQLSDRAFRKELVSWIRFNPREALRTGDGLAGRTTGQPPLPSWLGKMVARGILSAKRQSRIDALHLRSSAGIAVFVGERDDTMAWVQGGRAYERFALHATVFNIRNAFLNQPVEVRGLRSQLESWLNLGAGERALLMVRFGHGPTAPFSLRRPLDDVILE